MEYIKTYKNNQSGDKVKVFFVIDENGSVESVKMGNQVVPVEEGMQFYVDEYVALQIDKCELEIGAKPKIKIKESETIEIPDEVQQKQDRIKKLEKELRDLRGINTTDAE